MHNVKPRRLNSNLSEAGIENTAAWEALAENLQPRQAAAHFCLVSFLLQSPLSLETRLLVS